MRCTKCENFGWCPTRRGFLCLSFKRKEEEKVKAMTDKQIVVAAMIIYAVFSIMVLAYILQAGPIK